MYKPLDKLEGFTDPTLILGGRCRTLQRVLMNGPHQLSSPNKNTQPSTSTNKQQINPQEGITNQLGGRETGHPACFCLWILSRHHSVQDTAIPFYVEREAHLPYRQHDRQKQTDTLS